MGCMQVRVQPDLSVEQIESNKSKSTVSQVEIIRNEPDELDRSTAMYSTPVTMFESLVSTPGISTRSGDLIQHSELIASTTLVQSPNTNDRRDTGINEILSEFDSSTSHYNICTNPTSIDAKETPISPIKVPKSIDMNSNVSDIPEVSSVSITSSELDPLSSVNTFAVSSSPNPEYEAILTETINNFLSVRPKRSKNRHTSTQDNMWSGSDQSYSLHDSFVSSVTADFEASTPSNKSHVQHKTVADKVYSESDESILPQISGNKSAVKDMQMMTDHLVTVLRTTSARLNNPDDHSNEIISETINELNQG